MSDVAVLVEAGVRYLLIFVSICLYRRSNMFTSTTLHCYYYYDHADIPSMDCQNCFFKNKPLRGETCFKILTPFWKSIRLIRIYISTIVVRLFVVSLQRQFFSKTNPRTKNKLFQRLILKCRINSPPTCSKIYDAPCTYIPLFDACPINATHSTVFEIHTLSVEKWNTRTMKILIWLRYTDTYFH